MIALDAKSGKPCSGFGKGGTIDLRYGLEGDQPGAEYSITSAPTIYKDLVITGAAVPEYPSKGPSGMVRAFNVRTGKLVWTFHTIPRPGETGHQSWEGDSWKDRTGANVWSTMSVDVERGLVFLPIGSASYDFYGGDRKGTDLFEIPWSLSKPQPASLSGTSRWFITTFGTTTYRRNRLITLQRDGKQIPPWLR